MTTAGLTLIQKSIQAHQGQRIYHSREAVLYRGRGHWIYHDLLNQMQIIAREYHPLDEYSRVMDCTR